MNLSPPQQQLLKDLLAVLDQPAGRYRELNGSANLGEYLDRKAPREDEELLTEPMLADLMETLLGFPADSYFPQLGRSGLKPDFTPHDLIAHPFVLDAKSSNQKLGDHERQIRAYIDQRQLDRGILFNLREIRVYVRGRQGHEPGVSFELLPLWRIARGEALPTDELAPPEEFTKLFHHHKVDLAQKIERVRTAEPWSDKEAHGDVVRVDVDFLIDRLRSLSDTLIEDAEGQDEELRRHLALNPSRAEALLGELEAIAQDIAPGTRSETLPNSIDGYLGAAELPARIWRQYLLRVAQLALARIMLCRAWEDVGFVDEHLYDGGFGQVYDRLDHNLGEVLEEAFARGGQKYRWLFGGDNNYDWFRPRDPALAEALYSLSPVPLGKLDADVLGALYASYVDEIDRDRLGQFYTPRSVVKFMLDRAGFDGPDGVFRLEGDHREPVRVFDFATGSGGFLVEAARRIIDDGEVDEEDLAGLDESLAVIVAGFHGCEISPFPYYLTEINLLLQVSRLLAKIRLAGSSPQSFVLGVVHADTLVARNRGEASMEGLNPELRADRAELFQDKHFGLVGLDAEKQGAFARIRENESFDLVIGNPPYVAETGNRLLFDRLREIPAWQGIYRGKSDYLYYFLSLAAEKVAPGGKFCVITPAGWMNAGNADWLRERLADALRLDELFLFGSYRLFIPDLERSARTHRAPTPTVESAILIATKASTPKRHKLKIVALEDEKKAATALSGNMKARFPDRDSLLAEMARRARGRTGRKDGIHVHSIAQSDLVHDRPWPIKHGSEDVATQVVSALQDALDTGEVPVEPLSESWDIFQGIQTGADAYTPRVRKRLVQEFPEAAKQLDLTRAKLGSPILELPAGMEKKHPWDEHPEALARSIEPDAILYAAVDEAEYTSLVWLGRNDPEPKSVIKALERWKPVLENRADFIANPQRRWWETHRIRDKERLRGPKVIALYRTDRGRFALDESGAWQPSIKTTLVTPKSKDGQSVAYLCGLLNSELLDLWYAVRGKTPWHVRRNYEPKPMARMPYRDVDLTVDYDADRIAELEEALSNGSAQEAFDVADRIGAELYVAEVRADSPSAAEAAHALESLVRAIADNRRALLPHRGRFPGLTRVVKDPWSTGPVVPDETAILADLPKNETASVRTDPELEIETETNGALGTFQLARQGLEFRYREQTTALVRGPEQKLALLERFVTLKKKLLARDLQGQLLPRDVNAFEARVTTAQEEVDGLLKSGRVLVEAAERLVCRLYGLSRELEEAVVAHAMGRASRGSDESGTHESG